jgi:hypothetical protein
MGKRKGLAPISKTSRTTWFSVPVVQIIIAVRHASNPMHLFVACSCEWNLGWALATRQGGTVRNKYAIVYSRRVLGACVE